MDVFGEFEQLAQALADRQILYALIGGVAMALHAHPRFTRDIVLLVKSALLPELTALLKSVGYGSPAAP